jgi:hypothetical protein
VPGLSRYLKNSVLRRSPTNTRIAGKIGDLGKGGTPMKLLTFRKRGERITMVGAMSAGGEVVNLTAAYASSLCEKGNPHPLQFADAYIPMDMIEFRLP